MEAERLVGLYRLQKFYIHSICIAMSPGFLLYCMKEKDEVSAKIFFVLSVFLLKGFEVSTREQ